MWVVTRVIKQRGRAWEGERGARRQPALDGVTFRKHSALSEEGAGQRLTKTSRFFSTTRTENPSHAQPDFSCLLYAQFHV